MEHFEEVSCRYCSSINLQKNGKSKQNKQRYRYKVFEKLVSSIKSIPIKICHTDNWVAYSKLFSKEYLHIIGKDNTWRIERKNLNFRTHIKRLNRKTICFSKNEKIHDKVISMYIEKYYFRRVYLIRKTPNHSVYDTIRNFKVEPFN